MAKWLVIRLADEMPEKKMLRLLNNVIFHEASTWYESVPDIFQDSDALDKARTTWLRDGQHREMLCVTK